MKRIKNAISTTSADQIAGMSKRKQMCMTKRITADDLYVAVVERIKRSDKRFKTTPHNLAMEVCKSEFGVDFDSTGIDDFAMYDLIIHGAKENDYSLRQVPLRGCDHREDGVGIGLPYNYEFFFYPYRNNN